MLPRVTIIIPTMCEARRAEALQRAISSVTAQEGAEVGVLLVVNGSRVDDACLAATAQLPRVSIHRQERGSLPLAMRTGREQVRTEYFGFLDDDDEYLPDAIRQRLAPLLADARIDFVATNGYRGLGTELVLDPASASRVAADPLAAMRRGNWLASCGGLFRSATIGAEFFEPDVSFLEWTFLAYRLASCRRIAFVQSPTFRLHDTPGSLSKSPRAAEGELAVTQRMLELELPPDTRRYLRRRLTAIHHMLSEQYRRERRGSAAWRHHLASLVSPGGWRFLSYTRRLLF